MEVQEVSRAKKLLPRVKIFQQHIMLHPDEEKEDGWFTSSITPEIETLIEEWIFETGNTVIRVSEPGWFFSWLDNEQSAKSIIMGVSVIYRPMVEDEHERQSEEKSDDKPELIGPSGYAPNASTGSPSDFRP